MTETYLKKTANVDVKGQIAETIINLKYHIVKFAIIKQM